MLEPEQKQQLKRETFTLWKLNTGCGCGALLAAAACGIGIWQLESWWWRGPLILLLLFALLLLVASSLLDVVPWAWALLRFLGLAGGNWLKRRREEADADADESVN